MTEAAEHSGAPPPSLGVKVAYGVGAVAYGVKNNGFDYFVLLFYSQVVGLDARLVGVAMLIALVFDALSDPIVGYASDNLHSRWGRRHPFMYVSAIPVAVSYFLLWRPPDWSETQLFLYLTGLSVVIRTFITFYETPSAALVAELSPDYDQRTSMLSYRYYFGWTGGNLMTVMMFGWLLLPSAGYPDGRFNPDAYATYGVIASLMILGAILASAIGTHGRIPYLHKPPRRARMTLGTIYRDIAETLANRSFAALFLSALFGAVATGVGAALAFIIQTYFWELTAFQMFLLSLSVFLSAVIGFGLAPVISRTLGKKRGAIVFGLLAFTIAPLPVLLRLFDLMPPNGSDELFHLLIVIQTLDVGLIIATQILLSSMTADLVEQSELKTHRRSEGVFSAAVTLTRKSVQGFGVLAGGFILAAAEIPANAMPGQVSAESLFRLGLYYVPTLLTLWFCMIASVSMYRIDRDGHRRNLEQLAARARARS